MWRDELGERKAIEPQKVGSHFHGEMKEKGGHYSTWGSLKKSTPPESSWKEKERKSENTCGGIEQEILSPKSLTERKERVSIPPRFYKQWSSEFEVSSSVPGSALVKKQGESPGARSIV